MEYQEKAVLNTDVVREPDFQALLTSLRKEAEENYQLTQRVSYFGNTLKQIERRPEKELADPKKDPQGVIEHLWEEVWKLRKSNAELMIVANHFQSVIGS